jgi:hypothetical protein
MRMIQLYSVGMRGARFEWVGWLLCLALIAPGDVRAEQPVDAVEPLRQEILSVRRSGGLEGRSIATQGVRFRQSFRRLK